VFTVLWKYVVTDFSKRIKNNFSLSMSAIFDWEKEIKLLLYTKNAFFCRLHVILSGIEIPK